MIRMGIPIFKTFRWEGQSPNIYDSKLLFKAQITCRRKRIPNIIPSQNKRFKYSHPLNATIDIKIISEYDQEIPQSQTADNPMAPRGRAAQPSRDTRKTN